MLVIIAHFIYLFFSRRQEVTIAHLTHSLIYLVVIHQCQDPLLQRGKEELMLHKGELLCFFILIEDLVNVRDLES